MPILEKPERKVDVEVVSRDVLTMGLKMVTRGYDTGFHRHRKAQCVMAVSGVLTCEAGGGIWIVPPQDGPLDTPRNRASHHHGGQRRGLQRLHRACRRARPSFRVLHDRRDTTAARAPRSAPHYPTVVPEGGIESRVASLLLEEIAIAEVGGMHLPMPKDERLRAVFRSIVESPADRGTLATWAKRHAMSERTFARLVVAETGMSFGRWRQQLGIILAIQRMAEGVSVQQVAGDLGYESVGSFVTMFRKALGTSPGRYMAARSS